MFPFKIWMIFSHCSTQPVVRGNITLVGDTVSFGDCPIDCRFQSLLLAIHVLLGLLRRLVKFCVVFRKCCHVVRISIHILAIY